MDGEKSSHVLLEVFKPKTASSAFIHGQKRVGKTSIARALQSHLNHLDTLVVYLEGGDYIEPSPEATIARLGSSLCSRLRRLDLRRLEKIALPSFSDALSPLADYLDTVLDVLESHRIVVILDEFDELPLSLYEHSPLGNAFFLTLRSLSSRPKVSFILVGGERLTLIIDRQGVKLNKWKGYPVDYFPIGAMSDYGELVQRPVGNTLEFRDAAIQALYRATAGNPYFTKLICQQIFRDAIDRHDCDITTVEVDQSITAVLHETERNTFQHFWEDGILETGERATDKSIRRRKILIALSDVLRAGQPGTVANVTAHPLARALVSIQPDLQEFVTRKVLVTDPQGERYAFKVPFFERWLRSRGIHDIIVTFADLDGALIAREKEEALKVSAQELNNLVQNWGLYRGQTITSTKVQAWLDQFPDRHEQRMMFTLLQGLRFYSSSAIRAKLNEAHDIVRRGLIDRRGQRKVKRSDIVVSSLDSG